MDQEAEVREPRTAAVCFHPDEAIRTTRRETAWVIVGTCSRCGKDVEWEYGSNEPGARGLDVERLARALREWLGTPPNWMVNVKGEDEEARALASFRYAAEAIAAGYARLTAEEQD